MIIPELAHKSEDLMHRVAFYLETFELVEQDPELYDAMMEILFFLDEIKKINIFKKIFFYYIRI